MKVVFLDVDNTLYDSTRQVRTARRNAVDAMIEAGLPSSREKALSLLSDVVSAYGSNYEKHFDVLLRRLGVEGKKYHVIAAGIVAYHNTKISMLHPFSDTVPTLLKLRGKGLSLGIITQGRSVKQWEKLIRLGLQHFFDEVVISDEVGIRKPSPKLFELAAEELGVSPGDCLMVGDRLDSDILGAKRAGMKTVRILKGKYRGQEVTEENKPDYSIESLSALLDII